MTESSDLESVAYFQSDMEEFNNSFDLVFPEKTLDYSTAVSQESSIRGGIRVSLACVPCRSRHVKCGAETPICARCSQDGKPCFYAKSRRGLRDRNTSMEEGLPMKKQSDPVISEDATQVASKFVLKKDHLSHSSASPNPPQGSSLKGCKAPTPKRVIDLYYSCFHSAHPFLLPKHHFLSRWRTNPDTLKYIVPVMQYIGSLYASDIDSLEAKTLAMAQFNIQNIPSNGFTVQALLLLAIAMHANGDLEQVGVILNRAINLAVAIGMNWRTFASIEQDPVLAESWRRTYWFLYVTESVFAGYQSLNFSMFSLEATVDMPCEESEFGSIIPPSKTLEDYESRDFHDVTPVFSSFTYLLGLTRIAAYIFTIPKAPLEKTTAAVSNADTMLVNWKLHLPQEKQGVYDKNGMIDEILFRAHFMLQLLTIRIHRPHSQLYQLPLESNSAHLHVPTPSLTTTPPQTWLHTTKCLAAAEAAIALYALPGHIISHTPLMVLGLSTVTSVHLSACRWLLGDEEWLRAWNRIRLGMGASRVFGEVWKGGRGLEREMKGVARGVFEGFKPGSGVGNGVASEVVRGIMQIEDQNGIVSRKEF